MATLSLQEIAFLEHVADVPMLDQVMAWSATNSGSRNLTGLANMAELLASAFSILPAKVSFLFPSDVTTIDPNGNDIAVMHGKHLHLSVRPEAPIQLLLTGHMDTVFADDHPFQSPYWIDSDTLGGPGVADMKGGLAVMLAALNCFERSAEAHHVGYDILINSDEETGSLSSASLIQKLAQGKLAAFTYEPALPDGTLAGARAGSGNFSIIVDGKSAHAGRNPQDGRNAIVAAADLAVRLKAASTPTCSCNPAKIDGGGPNNIVPDRAVLRFNLRPHSQKDALSAKVRIDQIMQDIADKHEVTLRLHGGFNRPPKTLDHRAEKLFHLVQGCGSELGLSVQWQSTGGVCDGNNIAACGVPIVDTMGVCGGNIHSDREFLITSSLNERAKLSALTLLRIAQGQFA